MKKYLLLSAVIVTALACNKTTTLSKYTPPFSKNFTVTSLKHTQDTVNVGDTIYLSVAGTMSDSSQNIYPYITVTTSSSAFYWGTAPSSFGATASPIKLTKVIGAATNGLYAWTSTIMLTGATLVPSKTKLTITGLFTYQLSLSSEGGGTATASDAAKTVYVQ
jgi:hypothetical protein